jgi:Bacterial SH3 domain
MDPNRPERPSIFSKPSADDLDATVVPVTPVSAEPPEPPNRPIRPRPSAEVDRIERIPPSPSNPSRQTIALGVMGLGILVLGGFIAASLLSPEDPAAAAVPTASATVDLGPGADPSSAATSEPSASPIPTPVPTPTGPPAEVAVGGWATVTVGELNVRAAAGSGSDSVYRLVQGAAVNVAEGPTSVDGANWYRIASLGGAAGWVSSGWVAEPFLETLVDDPTLIRCGTVGRPVFEVVDGSPEPHDPLHIGDLAVPVAAFSDLALGVIELQRGMGQEVCFSAQVGSDGRAVIRTELSANACGHAVAEGGFFRLRPGSSPNNSISSQVKDPVILHPSVLVGGPQDDRKASNLWTIVSMMTTDGGNGCINASVVENATGTQEYRSANVVQCSIVSEYNRDSLKLTPAAGGAMAWIKLTANGYQEGQFPLNTPTAVTVNADTSNDAHSAYAWSATVAGCG